MSTTATHPEAPRREGQPILSVEHATVSYRGGAIEALNDVSICVKPSEIVVLLGPNGAGKTTMLRTITGLLTFNGGRLNQGTVTFDGQRIDGRKDWAIVRSGIGLVMEGRRVFARLTVEDNLRAGGSTRSRTEYKRNHEYVMDLFPRLAERRSVAAGLLSGGEQQMLAMARALMQSPRLLLLDEPSLGLAPLVVDQIRQIIRDINGSGTSVVLIEQNASMALSIADYGYILERRRIGHEGTGASLLGNETIRDLYLGIGTSGGTRAYRGASQARAAEAGATTEGVAR